MRGSREEESLVLPGCPAPFGLQAGVEESLFTIKDILDRRSSFIPYFRYVFAGTAITPALGRINNQQVG